MAVRRRDARKHKVRLSAFSSGNHVVRLAIGILGFPDASGVTVQPSFDGQARRAGPPYAGCAAVMSARASSCAARRTRSISP